MPTLHEATTALDRLMYHALRDGQPACHVTTVVTSPYGPEDVTRITITASTTLDGDGGEEARALVDTILDHCDGEPLPAHQELVGMDTCYWARATYEGIPVAVQADIAAAAAERIWGRAA